MKKIITRQANGWQLMFPSVHFQRRNSARKRRLLPGPAAASCLTSGSTTSETTRADQPASLALFIAADTNSIRLLVTQTPTRHTGS